MDISSLGSTYITGTASNALSQSQQAVSKLSGLSSSSLKGSTDDELMEVCKQFESYFLEQVFKEMKKTIPQSQDMSSSSQSLVDYFGDNLIQEFAAKSTEQNSLGLAQTLYEQLKRNVASEL